MVQHVVLSTVDPEKRGSAKERERGWQLSRLNSGGGGGGWWWWWYEAFNALMALGFLLTERGEMVGLDSGVPVCNGKSK